MLKDLQNKCSAKEFKELCFCLTLNSITDHPDYKMWTALSGRLKCFEKLRNNLKIIYPINKEETKIENKAFNKFLKQNVHMRVILNEMQSINNFSISTLLDDKIVSTIEKFEKDGKKINLVIEDDIRPKRLVKDDNELATSQENLLSKSIRNEKVSQSLLASNRLENSADINVNQEQNYRSEDNNQKQQININIDEEKLNCEKIDDELEKQKLNEVNDNIGSKNDDVSEDGEFNQKNNNQNDLSDLDKEEIFMKSGYEYYDYVRI